MTTLQIALLVVACIVAIFAIPALIWMLLSAPELDPQDEAGLNDNEAAEAAVVQSIHNGGDI